MEHFLLNGNSGRNEGSTRIYHKSMALIHGLVLICVCFQTASSLRVGNYPRSRINQTILPQDVELNVFARIITRYDIIAVPSISNPDEMRMVEEVVKQHNSNYRFYLSAQMIKPTLPVVNYYGIFYKSNVVTVTDFIRDQPTGALAAKVYVHNTGQEFVLSLVHLSGTEVIEELTNLPPAFDRLQDFFKVESILFVGDYNTFTYFISEDIYSNLTVTSDSRYQWFIDWTENTFIPVLSFLHGAAARFLARGDIINLVEPTSARVLDIMDFFNLTLPEAAGMGVFLPVEIELKEPFLKA